MLDEYLKQPVHAGQLAKGHMLALGCALKVLQRSTSPGRRAPGFRELRASIPLAKLLLAEDQGDAADAALEPIYTSFTEGFGMRDLAEVRGLLDRTRPP